MDKVFPLHLWHKTIPHAEIALNPLRGSRINPKLSTWEQMNGQFDFNAVSTARSQGPCTCQGWGERGTWATHAFEACYVGPVLDHYRCFTVWVTKSRKTRMVNQVVWSPPKTFPKLTSGELLRATIEDLKVLLLNPPTDSFVGNMEPTQ
jgi:hypothetical protein